VVNADDLGVSRGATLGILRAHREGIVTSASLAVTTPFYRHAVESCVQTCPELGIGLHFTLTSGNPVAPAARVPLLVNLEGCFRWRFLSLLRAVRGARGKELRAQVETELEAQLGRLQADGIRPDHIDSERHIHLIPEVFELVVNAARRHGIHWVRSGRDLGQRMLRGVQVPALLLNGGIAKSWLLSRLSHLNRRSLGEGVRSADYVASYLYTGRTDLMTRGLAEQLPASAVVELMVHPGIPEESRGIQLGNRELERYLVSPDRARELDACLEARNALNGLPLSNFARLDRLNAAVA